MEAGGLDARRPRGRRPGRLFADAEEFTYMVGKWQIMRLLGLYRTAGKEFRLGAFTMIFSRTAAAASIVEWILLDDPGQRSRGC